MSEILISNMHCNLAITLKEVIKQQENTERLELQASRWHETCELVAGTANHEAKMVTGLIFAAEPDRYFSKTTLHTALTERQGTKPGWVQSLPIPFKYCEKSLEPIGHIVRGTTLMSGSKNRLVTAYRFNKEGPEESLPAIGLLADWSLRWPDISVQKVMGATQSSGGTRAAETRINIIMDLLTHSDETVAVTELEGLSKVAVGTTIVSVEELERSRLVNVSRATENNDRELIITNNKYTGSRPFENFRLETRLAYEFLGHRQPGDKFSFESLFRYVAQRIEQIDPQYDLAHARSTLNSRISRRAKGAFPGIKRSNTYNDRFNTFTRVNVNPNYIEPLSELMEIIVGINDHSPALLAYGQQRATEIINNSQDINRLMAKAKKFSSNAQSKGIETNIKMIKAVIAASEKPLDAESVRDLLKNKKILLGKKAVNKYLYDLREKRELEAIQIRKNTSTERIVWAYSLPTQNEDNS